MPTSQDKPQGRHAAHFARQAETDSSEGRARRAATPRAATERSAGATNRASGMAGTTQMSERTARATRRAAAAHQRRSQGAKRKTSDANHAGPFMALLAVIAVLAMVGIGFLVVPNLFKRGEAAKQEEYPSGEEVIVVIPEGASGAEIAKLLIEHHVISDEAAFYQETQKQNADAKMKSGTYQFITGATVSEVVRQLVEGPNAKDYQLKIAEGLTVQQVAAAVENQLGIKSKDFLEQAKASNYAAEYPFLADAADDSLEGFLYGKTYDFGGTDMSADTVIRALLNQYQTEVASLDFEAAKESILERYNVDITDYGLIKLASIIEREATTDEDRPLISSVFYNRLSNGMYLQSDATMMYVTGGEVTANDLQTESPYNTYLNPGLTPTPICSPSLASIQAALDPAETDYFYFFINENVHQFSTTYEEHQQAINESINS